ncbi:DUF6152 family protein [Pseudothauera rhizosphaerae]|uniref:Uncharacterized protein n=1 Tax=Pseudothauera rhizosphaerae TaxID=2565932 RepID=A0A4S4ARV4_9RHOO|nr:DUF6152 family protein [Pseudothauera rhizosphaerae]THF62113.1 hypothetical protein E6O51_08125 [Pseudothauera rhizosphaerae]
MDRRLFLLGVAAAGTAPLLARAHHGWSGFDTATPMYVAGTVKRAKWQNPHVELVVAPDDPLALPADLKGRPLPAQSANVDGAALLARTRLPPRLGGEWTLELAPLFRINAWRIPEIGTGERVEAVGYVLRMDNVPPFMRVEYLFHAGRAYGLRSAPV